MRKKSLMLFSSLFIAVCLSTVAIAAGGHGHKKEKKVGILLVAFGSSEASAQVSFENIAKKTKTAYPDIPVRWAYTSTIIRKKLAKQASTSIPLKSPWPRCRMRTLPMWRFNPCTRSAGMNTTICAERWVHLYRTYALWNIINCSYRFFKSSNFR